MKTNNYYRYLLLLLLISFTGAKTYAYDIAVANADGVTIYYNYINDGTELEVTCWGTNIEYNYFYNGTVNIPNEVTYMNRTRNVTSIGNQAFYLCYGLTSVTIPNSVTSIGNEAFYLCTSLTSVTIPNSVISIEGSAFAGCSGLTSVTIPNSVTSISVQAFAECSGLTSVTIPNSVTSIENQAFYYCTGLTSVTIPNSVTSIGNHAFLGCNSLTSVISKMENPCTIDSNCFTQDVFYNSTLYVPQGTTNKYKSTNYWNKFKYIEESESGGSEPETCVKPTIGYSNGKLTFNSTTDGATCYYSITDTDIKAGSGEEVNLTVTYNVSVYASKAGYNNSETATATLCWIDTTPTTEGITNGVTQIPANAILIQADDGFISVSGVADGQHIAIYQTDGKQVATAKAYNGCANVATNISKGNTVIVKIGDKTVKLVMK